MLSTLVKKNKKLEAFGFSLLMRKKQVVRISHLRETRSICGLDGCVYFRASQQSGSEQQGAVRTHRSHLAFISQQVWKCCVTAAQSKKIKNKKMLLLFFSSFTKSENSSQSESFAIQIFLFLLRCAWKAQTLLRVVEEFHVTDGTMCCCDSKSLKHHHSCICLADKKMLSWWTRTQRAAITMCL